MRSLSSLVGIGLGVIACGAAPDSRHRLDPPVDAPTTPSAASASSSPPPHAAPPSATATTAPPASAAIAAPITPATAAPSAPSADLSTIAACVTSAVDQLGWLATTAHQGSFLRTALDRGELPEGCAALASDEHKWTFPIAGGGEVLWRAAEPRPRGSRADVELIFECHRGCSVRTTSKVVLPHRWHCFGWVHGRQHGTGCAPTRAGCEAKRATFERGARPTTPCDLQTGAAYCDRDEPERCFPSPWDCQREVPDGAGRTGRCVKTP